MVFDQQFDAADSPQFDSGTPITFKFADVINTFADIPAAATVGTKSADALRMLSGFEITKSSDGLIGTSDAYKAAAAFVREKGFTYDVTGKERPLNDQEVAAIADVVSRFPTRVLEDLKRGGVRIAIVDPSIFFAEPQVRRTTNDGRTGPYPGGNSRQEVRSQGGYYARNENIVTLRRDNLTKGVIAHEFGHAWDRIMGDLSSQPEFKDLFDREFAKRLGELPDAESQSRFSSNYGSRSEIFASLFGRSVLNREFEDVDGLFPDTQEWLRRRIYS